MPTFEWICHDCKVFWEKDYSVGKAPSRTKCPECKKLCEKNWQSQNVGLSFGDDRDYHTVRARYKKHSEKGFDKTAADRFLNRSIDDTKERLNDEAARYKSVSIDYAKLARDGKVRKLSQKEASEKQERSKKLTEQAYDNANKLGYKDVGSTQLDIAKPQKQQ